MPKHVQFLLEKEALHKDFQYTEEKNTLWLIEAVIFSIFVK